MRIGVLVGLGDNCTGSDMRAIAVGEWLGITVAGVTGVADGDGVWGCLTAGVGEDVLVREGTGVGVADGVIENTEELCATVAVCTGVAVGKVVAVGVG